MLVVVEGQCGNTTKAHTTAPKHTHAHTHAYTHATRRTQANVVILTALIHGQLSWPIGLSLTRRWDVEARPWLGRLCIQTGKHRHGLASRQVGVDA